MHYSIFFVPHIILFIQTKMRKRVYKTSELPRMDQQAQLNWEFRSIDRSILAGDEVAITEILTVTS
jgi:hypothetical protein